MEPARPDVVISAAERILAATYSFEPIGVVRSPFVDRASAPRQATMPGDALEAGEEVAVDRRGRIELEPGRGFEDALDGLAGWDYVWVVFVFHKNVEEGRGWRPKVLPPRSDAKRGVFATRSPHRPNPIGLSAVKIERVEGLTVHVAELDLLDGTPVLDLKPYVAYADAHPDAQAGWLEARDPLPPWDVAFDPAAAEQLAWLRDRGADLAAPIRAALALGPQPHAYRRIRAHAGGLRLALKEWRADFRVDDGAPRRLVVTGLASGYRPRELAGADPALDLHRAFAARFPEVTP